MLGIPERHGPVRRGREDAQLSRRRTVPEHAKLDAFKAYYQPGKADRVAPSPSHYTQDRAD
ncbi:hypothetical protein D3C76_1687730 [compost metagenome]